MTTPMLATVVGAWVECVIPNRPLRGPKLIDRRCGIRHTTSRQRLPPRPPVLARPPQRAQRGPMTYPDTSLFIDDAWVDAADGRTIPVHNPATGEVIGSVAHATAADLDRALAAAQRGFAVWRDQTPAQRSTIMRRAAQLLRDRLDEIGRLITLEQGKP